MCVLFHLHMTYRLVTVFNAWHNIDIHFALLKFQVKIVQLDYIFGIMFVIFFIQKQTSKFHVSKRIISNVISILDFVWFGFFFFIFAPWFACGKNNSKIQFRWCLSLKMFIFRFRNKIFIIMAFTATEYNSKAILQFNVCCSVSWSESCKQH